MELARALAKLRGGAGRSAPTPIGFDLGTRMLRMAQLEGEGDEARIRAAASIPYPVDREVLLASPPQLKALVREGLRRGPFRGRRIVTPMPGPDLKLMVLNYELAPQQSEPGMILRLVEERIGETAAESVVDYLPIRRSGESQGERSALVAVARREAVIGHLELLRAAGLEVEALEIAPVAVRRLVLWLAGDDARHNSLVIHCGRRAGNLTVLWGRRLVLYREIDFAEEPMIEELSKSLDLSAEETKSLLHRYGVFPDRVAGEPEDNPAAAREIANTLMEIAKPSFYALAEHIAKAAIYTASQWRGASVDQIYLLGRAARWPGVEELLQSLVSMPVRILDPLAALPRRSGSDSVRPEDLEPNGGVALSVGLALRPRGGHV